MYAMNTLKTSVLAIASVSMLVACGQDDLGFNAAIPDAELLTMDFPNASTTTASASVTSASAEAYDGIFAKESIEEGEEVESARCFDATKNLAEHANKNVSYVLDTLDRVTDGPYTEVNENTYLWGPAEDTENGVIKQLFVTANADGSYVYDFQAAPISTGFFVSIVTGVIDAGSTKTEGSGSFIKNLDNLEIVQPTGERAGVMTFDYSQDAEKVRVIDVNMVAYLFENGEKGDANLFFDRAADGSGALDWERWRDLSSSDPAETAQEFSQWRSRWTPEHAGRCDGKMTDGELGPHLVTAHECWDTTTAQVYYTREVDGQTSIDSSTGEPVTSGDASLCAFADASYME